MTFGLRRLHFINRIQIEVKGPKIAFLVKKGCEQAHEAEETRLRQILRETTQLCQHRKERGRDTWLCAISSLGLLTPKRISMAYLVEFRESFKSFRKEQVYYQRGSLQETAGRRESYGMNSKQTSQLRDHAQR